jgi:hypothetical protein
MKRRSSWGGNTAGESGQLKRKKRILRELRNELRQLGAGQFHLVLAQGRQRQQNLCKRSKVMASRCGNLELRSFLPMLPTGCRDAKPPVGSNGIGLQSACGGSTHKSQLAIRGTFPDKRFIFPACLINIFE